MKVAINCLKIVANTIKIEKFLVRKIFIHWDAFIICKINKKPGQMYQKCLITYSAAVFFQGFTINLRFNPVCSGVFFFWSCLPRGEGAAHSAPPCVNPDRKMLLTWNLAQAHTLSCYKKNGRKKIFKIAAIRMMKSLILSFFWKIIPKMAKICFFSSKINLATARKKIFKIFFQLLKVKITYKLNIYGLICCF